MRVRATPRDRSLRIVQELESEVAARGCWVAPKIWRWLEVRITGELQRQREADRASTKREATMPRPKLYIVIRDAETDSVGCTVLERVVEDAKRYALPHWQCHSTEFEIGYPGSGPADLALAMLSDFLEVPVGFDYAKIQAVQDPDELRKIQCAWEHHQPFKFAHITPAQKNGGLWTSEQLAEFIQAEHGGALHVNGGTKS